MSKIKNVRALGEMVVLKFVPVKKTNLTKNGLLLVKENEKEEHEAIVDSIGPDVKDPSFKVGDKVIFNNYDLMMVEEEDPEDASKVIKKGFVKASSIWGIYE